MTLRKAISLIFYLAMIVGGLWVTLKWLDRREGYRINGWWLSCRVRRLPLMDRFISPSRNALLNRAPATPFRQVNIEKCRRRPDQEISWGEMWGG